MQGRAGSRRAAGLTRLTLTMASLTLAALSLAACGSSTSAIPEVPRGPAGAELESLEKTRIEVRGVTLEVWVARSFLEQQRGLMDATPAQVAPLPDGTPRGMLFPFDRDQTVSIVMTDTYVPLDLAFLRADGVIVQTHRLTPLDRTPVPSDQPVRWALEVPAGTFAAHGIGVGDTCDFLEP